MKYTENLVNKLILAGFELSNAHQEEELYYEVFKRRGITVTINHTDKTVITNVYDVEVELKGIYSISDLKTLHRLIYGITPLKLINNKEGD